MQRLSILALTGLLLFACGAMAAPWSMDPDLRQYLKAKFKDEPDVRVSVAKADLTGREPPEVIVYLQGPGMCGSGGCEMMILQPLGRSYRLVTETSITKLPIRELPTKSHGWRDLAVWVGGGGAKPGSAVLRFNGRRYPENPSMAPRTSSKGGRTLISETDEGVPLR